MFLSILLILLGLALLIKGADWLVEGASALARKHHVSDLAIGLTIVAFGTSAPELVVSLFATVDGNQGIVMGNVIGSNVFNLFAILGVAGLIAPLTVQSSTVSKEIPLSLLAVMLLFLLANDARFWGAPSVISRIDGAVLLLMFAGFLYYVYSQMKVEIPVTTTEGKMSAATGRLYLMIAAGLAGLIIGGRLVVAHAVAVADELGMSERVIGATIVAAGTSLPELVTSVVAALKKNNDIAVGNIIGSNIFNIFFILAISVLVKPLSYDVAFNREMFLLMAGTIALFIAMFTGRRRRVDRWEAALLLLVYIAFTAHLVSAG